ncbi:hypothetical protein NDU88_000102 [Pleurodeles waltl]|uniref:Uncharacterized protein n=1 Tax=Pleurodeles waltl TaxID=8319 RepID=A0AAV7NAY5_PLEWA|nr:hypothetical protein NDU88_000102 [Pleurodeles waltl]
MDCAQCPRRSGAARTTITQPGRHPRQQMETLGAEPITQGCTCVVGPAKINFTPINTSLPSSLCRWHLVSRKSPTNAQRSLRPLRAQSDHVKVFTMRYATWFLVAMDNILPLHRNCGVATCRGLSEPVDFQVIFPLSRLHYCHVADPEAVQHGGCGSRGYGGLALAVLSPPTLLQDPGK